MRQLIHSVVLVSAVLTLAGWGCATQPHHDIEVTNTKRTMDIERTDVSWFAVDRASGFAYAPQPLPPSERREEYYVRWHSPSVTLVKFEYRQINTPTEIETQTFTPQGKNWNTFAVGGEDLKKGGTITAWRVSLWTKDSQLLAEKKSPLW